MIGFLGKWRRERALANVSIPDADWQRIEDTLPFLAHLDRTERSRLRELAREFIATKEWSGAQGLALHPAMQLAIALQACLPVLKRGLDAYAGWVGIVVYPGDFVIPRQIVDADGIVHEYEDEVLGEAWEGGPVLISWFDDAEDLDGVNVVIHEFAHKLDMTNGEVDGMPALPDDMKRRDWIAAFAPAYEDFCRKVDLADTRGEDTELDPYASESPGEFFAVMSEAFFETPDLLKREYPEVYDQLRRYYLQDPAGRTP